MQNIFSWILIALGPSIAALAWFTWSSDQPEDFGREISD